tara:strand:+ start:114 stop:743 length:630 start_codon:yes stop_codon:yes gene_type:complete
MKHFYKNENELQVGLDESGRGCLLGPVCIGAVILNDITENPPPYPIKDSKKCSSKIRKILREYIENNSIAYHVQFISESEIDKHNILKATMNGMHLCLNEITKQLSIDRILVDGNYFIPYTDNVTSEIIPNICIPNGDNKYMNIAAASILAKEYRDEYIIKLCKDNKILYNYDILNNKGYGTKYHMESLKDLGPTKWHRKTFKPKYLKE